MTAEAELVYIYTKISNMKTECGEFPDKILMTF